MSTESVSSRFADLDLWPTREALQAMLEGQLAAAAAVQPQIDAIAAAAEAAAERLADSKGRLIYVGAGTSGRIGVQDGVELGPTFSWPTERLVFGIAGGSGAILSSVEGAEDDTGAGEELIRGARVAHADVVIGIAASGRTLYTVAAVAAGAAAGALTVGISSNLGTPLLEAAAHPILIETGPEILAGSTRMKAGTAHKIALNLFSTAVMLRLGRVYKGFMVDMRVSNAKLRRRAIGLVGQISGASVAECEAALDDAQGNIKLAALIALGEGPGAAAAILARSGGNLRIALGSIDGG